MGKRGPAPKPAEVARIDGTYRADRHGEAPILSAKPTTLPAPRHLSPAQRKAWREIVKPLEGASIVQAHDSAALEMMSVSLATYREADELVRSRGLMVDRVFGFDKQTGEALMREEVNPALAIRDRAEAAFMRWAARFGFTPSDRVSLGIQVIKGRQMQHSLSIGQKPGRRR